MNRRGFLKNSLAVIGISLLPQIAKAKYQQFKFLIEHVSENYLEMIFFLIFLTGK